MYPNIALTGRSGAGKTTVAGYLAEHYRYAIASTGTVCREVCGILFGSQSKTVMNQVTDAMRALDESVWMSAALRRVPAGRPVVVDAARFKPDMELLRARGFVFWRVEAPLAECVRRLSERGQEFSLGVDDIHSSETEWAQWPADVAIANHGPIHEELYRLVEAALNTDTKVVAAHEP
ncbi:MAG: hypothetical protein HY751_01170 [Nitrospinae bacterium]|nr:hypothetical protein [Nitrospinota bacterium]